MTPFTVDAAAGNDPNQTADGSMLPLAKSPIRIRSWAASGTANEPLRQERVRGRLHHDSRPERDRRRDHLDA